MIWLLFILLIIDAIVIYNTSDPKNLRIIKDKYNILIRYIENNPDQVHPKFHILKDKHVIITGMSYELGYNISKGDEIGLCLDGDPNDIFHVFIHELAHTTVPEYDHSEQFWRNCSELQDLCASIGIYTKITEPKQFCGGSIVSN
jgi:WLM domain